MDKTQIKRLSVTAMFTALVFAFTWIQVPAPFIGNINLGDALILLSAWTLGGWGSVIAAGAGAALCDLLGAYAIYAPGTFFIKALMALSVLGISRLLSGKKLNSILSLIISGICGELVMILGYFIYESVVLRYGFPTAAANIPFNAIQGVCGIAVGLAAFAIFKKAKINLK